MSPRDRVRSAGVLLALGLIGGGLVGGGVFASAAIADDDSQTAPITVTIPGNGSNSPSPSSTPSQPADGGDQGGDDQGSDQGSDQGGNGQGGNPNGGGGQSGNHGGGGHAPGGGGDAGASNEPHAPGTEPKVPKNPAKGTLKVTVTPHKVFRAHDDITVSAAGFSPSEKVQLVIFYQHGKAVKVGNFGADAKGTLTQIFKLPALDAGTDTVQLTGWDSSKVGTGTFLMGVDAIHAASQHHMLWLGIGGGAGLVVACVGAWIGIRSILAAPMIATKA